MPHTASDSAHGKGSTKVIQDNPRAGVTCVVHGEMCLDRIKSSRRLCIIRNGDGEGALLAPGESRGAILRSRRLDLRSVMKRSRENELIESGGRVGGRASDVATDGGHVLVNRDFSKAAMNNSPHGPHRAKSRSTPPIGVRGTSYRCTITDCAYCDIITGTWLLIVSMLQGRDLHRPGQ